MTQNFIKGTGKILAGILLLYISGALAVISRASGTSSGFLIPSFFGLPASSIEAQAVLGCAGYIIFMIGLAQCSKEDSIFRKPLLLGLICAGAACIGSAEIFSVSLFSILLLVLAAACFAAQLMVFEHLKACSRYILSEKVLDLVRTWIIMAALLAFVNMALPFLPAGLITALLCFAVLASAGAFYLLGFLRLEEKLKTEYLKSKLEEEAESEGAFA